MSDDRVETHVVIDDPDDRRAQGRALPGVLGAPAAPRCRPTPWCRSASTSRRPAPGVLEAITEADLVLVPPSNPVVSVGTILGVPGIRDALARHAAPVVGVSGIIGADHVRGMARQLLDVIGVEVSRRRRRPSTTGPAVGRRRARRLAGGHRRRRAGRARRGAGIRVPGGAADDDRPRRHRGMVAAALDLAGL